MVDAAAHNPAATTTSTSPATTVRFGPNRAAIAPVTSIATHCTLRYEANSRVVCEGVACRPSAMDSRIGSTRPIPMKAMTAANAVTQTVRGCPRSTSRSFGCCVGAGRLDASAVRWSSVVVMVAPLPKSLLILTT